MYDTIIFDLDGTLLNTLDDLADSLNYALDLFRFPQKSVLEVKSYIGNGVRHLIHSAVPQGTPGEEETACMKCFQNHYSKNMRNKTRPYDGVMELLKTLKARGCRMAVVSNKYDTAVKALCNDVFAGYIPVAIGESAGVRRKPEPDTVLKAIQELGTSCSSTLYVGDSETDVRTAKNAGLPCVGVSWGFRDRSVLQEEGADVIIDAPNELIGLLDGTKL